MAEIDLAQELDAAGNTGELLAGDAERAGLLRADGEIKALVALLAELRDGDIFSNLHAAPELHAHFAENVYLGVQNVLFQPEGRDAEREHAAGDRVFVEHGDGVALVGKVVGAAHTGGAGADDGDLFRIWLTRLVDHFRNKARFLVAVVIGDEALDLVNGNGLVHAGAGAFPLARLVADAAAHRGERVFLFDELERVGVPPLRGELQIPLHGDMRRAGRLAGGGAGIERVLEVFAVIGIEGFADVERCGELGIVRRRQIAGRAKLLAKLECIAGTGLHTLRARHALCLVDLGDEVGADGVPRTEHQPRAQTEARARAAVADGGAVAELFNVRDVVHEAVFLGAVDDLQRLLAGDLAGTAGADVMLRALAHLDAHLLVQMAAAVADARARAAAGARGDGERVVFIEIVRKLFVGAHAGDVLDGVLHGNNAHQAIPLRQQGAHHLHAQAGVFFKRTADLRVVVQQLLVVDHHFENAGRKDLHEVCILAVLLGVCAAENAVLDKVIE